MLGWMRFLKTVFQFVRLTLRFHDYLVYFVAENRMVKILFEQRANVSHCPLKQLALTPLLSLISLLFRVPF